MSRLEDVLGYVAFGRLRQGVTGLLTLMCGEVAAKGEAGAPGAVGPGPPRDLRGRAAAALAKFRRQAKQERSAQKENDMDDLFANGARLAHKLTNQLNTVHDPGIASDGTTSHGSHMADQWAKFQKLWEANVQDASEGYYQAYCKVRAVLVRQRVRGQAWALQQLRERFAPARVRQALQRFKRRTPTGFCNVVLAQLRELPCCVLEPLCESLAQSVHRCVGPDQGLVSALSLLPKKSSDYRTVATVISLWRLMLGILCEDLCAWEDVAAHGCGIRHGGAHGPQTTSSPWRPELPLKLPTATSRHRSFGTSRAPSREFLLLEFLRCRRCALCLRMPLRCPYGHMLGLDI